MIDGIYFDVITIKDGTEYLVRRITVAEVSKILTDSMLDGISAVLGISENDIKEYREKHES